VLERGYLCKYFHFAMIFNLQRFLIIAGELDKGGALRERVEQESRRAGEQ
jgi:hypothetical protein